MPSIVKILRAAAEPSRLRILLLLKEEELSVAELQEILTMGQSSISTHLSQLKQAGLVEDRRTGKNNLYRLSAASPAGGRPLEEILAQARQEIPETAPDHAAMRRVVKKRQDKMRSFFDSMAGRLGKDYVPGKSWKSMAEAFLHLLPPMTIADLGSGDGGSAVLLSRSAVQVIGVDASEKMLEVARDQALRAGASNVDFRLGEMEELPIDDASVDLVFFSQSLHHAAHPERALREAARILRPGGRIVILDLAKHRFEEARELYADEWLGFSEAEMEEMLAGASFIDVRASIVDRDPEAPQFQTLLAVARKSDE
ncbi:MAG TPA: metalloregulator ArsR/SmtB family transcription factor [Terracidiphilus sp.]|jgi:ArsR family transcriptional regulator|nr:metalloregulator ArsR/SmtB family transcription factor [Terracidiphilus sp.]HTB98577.1 metalloregulator ArsR/SmtB family transcription factor [Terracidiphilus sp.]